MPHDLLYKPEMDRRRVGKQTRHTSHTFLDALQAAFRAFCYRFSFYKHPNTVQQETSNAFNF